MIIILSLVSIIICQHYLGILGSLFQAGFPIGRTKTAPLDCSHLPDQIPNIVHYVYVLKDGVSGASASSQSPIPWPRSLVSQQQPTRITLKTPDLNFEFRHFLSLYSAHSHLHTSTIYLHTNAPPAAIARARNGPNKWNRLLLTHILHLQINHVVAPLATDNGRNITEVEHQSDFVRQQAVFQTGHLPRP